MRIIIFILSTYYIQQILRLERGPFGILDKAREFVGVKTVDLPGGGYKQEAVRPGELSGLILCVYCMSFWVSLAVSAVGMFVYEPAVWPFAIAGGAVVVDSLVRWLNGAS